MGEDHDYASAQNKFLRSGLSTKPRTVIDFVAEPRGSLTTALVLEASFCERACHAQYILK